MPIDELDPHPVCPECEEDLCPRYEATDGSMLCVTADCALFGIAVSRKTILDRHDEAVEKDWEFRQRMRLT